MIDLNKQETIEFRNPYTGGSIQMSIAGKFPQYHFRFLTGDVNFTTYGGSWISKPFSNDDFTYYLVIELRNRQEDLGDDANPVYEISISAVSPEAAADHLAGAFESGGAANSDNVLAQVEALYSYGISANLWYAEGNNWHKLMSEAHKMAAFIHSYFGFYMDVPLNRIGNTGWDLIQGHIGF
jgi:hypothetical protein